MGQFIWSVRVMHMPFKVHLGPPKDAHLGQCSQQNRRNSGNAYDGKEGGTKIQVPNRFVQHLITDKIPGITNILAEDIDQDGDMDIITADVGGIGILQYNGSPLFSRTQKKLGISGYER